MRIVMHMFLSFVFILSWVPSVSAQKTNPRIDSLLFVLSTAPEDTIKVQTLNVLCVALRHIGETARARAYADSAIVLGDQLQYKTGSSAAYNMRGLLDMKQGDHVSALNHFDHALRINSEIGYKNGMTNNITNMGLVYWSQSNYPEALEKFTIALQMAEELEDKRTMLGIYNNIGTIYGAQGKYPEALEKFLATLKLARETGNSHATAISLKNVGTVYGYQGKHEEALAHFQEHLRLMEELGNKEGIANAYDQIGIIAERQGKHEEALVAFSDALKLFEEIDNPYSEALVHNHFGSVFIGMANYPEALNSLQKALQIREDIEDKEGIAESYGSIGRVFSKQAATLPENEANKKYQEAILFTNKSLALAKELGYAEGIKGMYNQLTETYTAMGDYKNALEYNSLFIAIKDSLLNNESTRKLEQLRTQYEVETAVAKEKVKQDSLLAVQQFESEKELADRHTLHQLEIAEAKAQEERAIEAARYRYLMQLSTAKTKQEKVLAEQQYHSELQIAEETARHQIALAEEKASQDRKEAEAEAKAKAERAERKRKTGMLLSGVGLLVLISFFTLLYQRQRNLKRKAIERADTIHKMTELELQSLRAQLNPHFMFNSLNAIQELILMQDNDRSHIYLARFAKLLRILLENANSPFIPLAREKEFLDLYLSLEKLRIPELQFTIDVEPDINPEQIQIPNMILQPYIENAIWHGLSPKQGEKKLQVSISRQNGNILYDIEDNGVGRQKAAELKSQYRKEHKSRGMELLTKRFRLLSKEFGSDISISVDDVMKSHEVAGTKVTIAVPDNIQAQTVLQKAG